MTAFNAQKMQLIAQLQQHQAAVSQLQQNEQSLIVHLKQEKEAHTQTQSQLAQKVMLIQQVQEESLMLKSQVQQLRAEDKSKLHQQQIMNLTQTLEQYKDREKKLLLNQELQQKQLAELQQAQSQVVVSKPAEPTKIHNHAHVHELTSMIDMGLDHGDTIREIKESLLASGYDPATISQAIEQIKR